MSRYEPDNQEYLQQLNDTEHKLQLDISLCKSVEATLNSEGWQKIIGPTLDRMIIDVVGGKVGKVWHYGELQKATNEDNKSFFVGYKQGLIKFHNQIHNHTRILKSKQGQLKAIDKDRNAGFNVPLLGEVKESGITRTQPKQKKKAKGKKGKKG